MVILERFEESPKTRAQHYVGRAEQAIESGDPEAIFQAMIEIDTYSRSFLDPEERTALESVAANCAHWLRENGHLRGEEE